MGLPPYMTNSGVLQKWMAAIKHILDTPIPAGPDITNPRNRWWLLKYRTISIVGRWLLRFFFEILDT